MISSALEFVWSNIKMQPIGTADLSGQISVDEKVFFFISVLSDAVPTADLNVIPKIVKIGNSQGIRIPKIILQESQISNEVELIAEHEQIIIRSIKKTRSGWDESFKTMAQNNDDKLLDEEQLSYQSSWDKEEWEWE
jgi:antitoxin MazE